MLAQLVLTTAEAKKLISKAVWKLPQVQKAKSEGWIVIHPSSTTAFLYEELTGTMPSEAWVFGVSAPGGLCRSKTAINMLHTAPDGKPEDRKIWTFQKGKLAPPMSLDEILSIMGEGDVFVKGCNALDHLGKTAVLTSSPKTGGTIGKVISMQRSRHFSLVLPVGLEKLIPGTISGVHDFLGERKADAGMGIGCGIFPVQGLKMDERDALKLLCGVEAIAGAAGGLCGAEGASILYVDDTEVKIHQMMELIQSISNAKLPELDL